MNQRNEANFLHKASSDSVNSHLNNSPESQNIPSNQTNKNDDNCSNASTSYSNAHSEIHAYAKNTIPPFTVTNHLSDDTGRNIEKNSRSKNLEPFQDKKRRNSGASRTSLTSTPSDMVSDNESASVHSQNNFHPDLCMQHLSPELQERTVSSGSLGGTESNGSYLMNNFQLNLNRNYSTPQNYVHNSNSQDNFANLQAQKRKSKNYPNGKGPYQNYGQFNNQSSQHYAGRGSGYENQHMISPQGNYYKNRQQYYNQNKDYNNNYHQSYQGSKNEYGASNTYRGSHNQFRAEYNGDVANANQRYQQYLNPGPFSAEIPAFSSHSLNAQNQYSYTPSNDFSNGNISFNCHNLTFLGIQEGQNTSYVPRTNYKNMQNQPQLNQYSMQPNNGSQNVPMSPQIHENNKLRDEVIE